MSDLTAERLREVLDYCPDTGVFTWKIRSNRRVKVGDVAGALRHNGYIQIGIDGCLHRAHRLAWLYVTGESPPSEIDHINCVKNDNRIANLRLATSAENKQNQSKAQKRNKAGFLGVSPHEGKFQAQIKVDGKKMHIGRFNTPEEAHAAYLEAKRRLHPFGTI